MGTEARLMVDKAKRKHGEDLIDEGLKLIGEAEDWDRGIVAGWVLVADMRGVNVDEDGDSSSGVAWVYSGGTMPWPQAIGIIRCASVKMERDYVTMGDEDEGG